MEYEKHSVDTSLSSKDEDAGIIQDNKLPDGKKKQEQRSEPAVEASEFHTSTGQQKVMLHKLVGTFKNKASLSEVKKQLNTLKKRSKTLPTPLSKQDQERVQRSIAYDATKDEVSKWEPIVQQHRKAEQITFPLNQPDFGLESNSQVVQRFQPRTTLEVEISKALQGSEHVFTKNHELTKAEQKALQALSLEEAKERRAELQKFRTLLSYKEAKQRRQNKIKSKKYHRIQRKEKLRKDKKELSDLQVHDPEAFAEKLVLLEKERVQERISLKHKGGSRNMKKKMAFSKYDDQARQSLQDMLEKNKELTQKIQQVSSSSDEEEQSTELTSDIHVGVEKPSLNPWMTHGAPKQSATLETIQATQGSYKRPEAVENNEVTNKHDRQSDSSDDEGIIQPSLTVKRRYEDFDDEIASEEKIPEKKKRKDANKLSQVKNKDKANEKKAKESIDPTKVLSLPGQHIETSGVYVVTDGDGSIDNIEENEQQRMTIAQAFADDDIIEEFSQEKSLVEERDKPKDIDLTLPGWGDWGGMSIQYFKKKKKRFIIKAPQTGTRMDSHLGNVIISETKDNTIASHQVNRVPFPFTNVQQFESSIRTPIGKTWNTETSFRELVKPKVVTRMGKVIEPIDKTVMFKKQKVSNKGLDNDSKSDNIQRKNGLKKREKQQKTKKQK